MTQADRILLELQSNERVPAYKLGQIALQYNACIKKLRERGYNIINQANPKNRRLTYFRLVPDGELSL